jgi:acyl carrier protein/SAM-dependent methyltransferase
MLFDIDHQCDRFQKIVAGHAVLGQPLCPASLYMECATMAAGLVKGIEGKANVQFDDMDFLAPLGLGLQQKITLTLEQLESDMAWTFTVESARSDSPLNPSIHCKGKLVLSQTAEFPRWSRFLDGRVKRLKESENAEKILSKRAYGLFSRVVSYFTFLKGIQCIYIDGNEALATIILPKDDQPGRHESTAWQRCDTCLTDVFISTAGLLLNSSGMVPEDQVMIATGVEQVVLGPTCTMDLPVQWTVYAMFTMVSELNALGDIFVYSSQGTMVAAFSGVRFAKVQMFKLRRTLQSINPKSTVSSVAATIDSASATPDAISTIMSTPSTNDSDQEVDVSATTLAGIKDTIRSLIAGFVGLDGSKMPMDALLADLGIDSLSSIELAAEIQTELEVSISSEDVCNMTVAGLCQRVSGSMPEFAAFEAVESMQSCEGFQVGNIHLKKGIQYQIAFDDPFQLLIKAQSRFDMAAKKHGFTNYWDEPHRLQSELLGAYILEAFEELGLNLKSMPPATPVPPLPNIPKHNRLVYRLWTILQAHGIIERQGNVYTTVGGRGNTNFRSSHEIHDIFTARFPQYRSEANVMGLTGPKLASCLLGQQSPIALMFGSQSAAKVMEEYYRNSPMLSVFTDLLVGYVMELCKGVATSLEAPIRILEVGAGTGGTTTKLADALAATGVACQYTFTDISTTLVSQARDRFGKYPWMDFHIFDLEREVETTFRNEYHIVIGTNVVHATRDRVLSCQRLRDTLTDDGILILSEVTRVIDWYDICFGLLDGWWYASNGTEYPLQSSCVWLEALRAAGFPSTGCSRGTSPESTTQQLLVGFKRALQPTVPVAVPHHIDVMEYKEVDGVRIHADVYVPHTVKPAPMPLALLIHGGGHMSLSRKAIRSAQVNHLLANGYLPVSLDYRLCPEINLIDGAMTDVRDGYWWARNKLPLDLLKRGFVVDSDHVVVVGWSTGGHLAMSIAWTTMEVGMPPPARILSFYAPVDFESRGKFKPHNYCFQAQNTC